MQWFLIFVNFGKPANGIVKPIAGSVVIDVAGLGNDVEVTISGAAADMSKFHVSYLNEDMNGPEDCGKRQGSGKKDDAGLINGWLLMGWPAVVWNLSARLK